ncbi:hypothetical protein CDAR_535811 [Caerostris darwini]|uniref:PID domain-containing protein n=1 Tax=Caerostris darwini TaxID=1538125 RepID=A0AAV4QMW8_9ARAC|nr:hypothetical protein CDAR_535811 [Caerostris darwini]
MSVSHPLLKQLKGHVYDLRKDTEIEVRDHHSTLLPLCHTLEEIFQTGLKTKLKTPFGLMKKDYWSWIQFLYEQREKFRIPFAVVETVESVQCNKKTYTNLGRGRLFMRTALTFYDPNSSILGNEIMCEILLSLLHELNKIDFKLELKNASFLDETWNLGVYKKYEFVPCKEMGITFAYAKGRVVVVKVDEGSVAAEENQIEPGDVLDELYGHSLYRCNRGLISSLASKYRGLPIYLSIVKGFYVGSIYSPLKPIFEKLRIRRSIDKKEKKENDFESELISDSATGSLKFQLALLGRFEVPFEEKAECIDKAISQALQLKLEPQEVTMFINEREIKIFDDDEKSILIHKHFSEISACGRKKLCPDVFAFIFGNTTCTIAEEFQCFVLRATSPIAIANILELIAHGFVKTHWEV